MAGGRRPVSYVSGARHHTTLEHPLPSPPVNPSTPPPAPPASLPLWIPSIWQPSPIKSPIQEDVLPIPLRERQHQTNHPSSALAAALDSAVHSAVVRALGNGLPPSPQIQSSTVSSETILEDDCPPLRVAQRERDLVELIDGLRERLSRRDHDVVALTSRMDDMETRLSEAHAENAAQKRLVEDLSARLGNVAETVTEHDRKHVARANTLRDLSRANQNAVSKLRVSHHATQAHIAETSVKTQQLTDELHQLSDTICSQLEKNSAKVEQHDQSLRQLTARIEEQQLDTNQPAHQDVDKLRRNLDAATEDMTFMRSRLKRAECIVDDVSKQTNDSLALTSGFEDSIRAGVDEIRASVAALHTTVNQLQGTIPEWTSGSDGAESSKSRLTKLESNIKSLKKLIESNLRTQWSAENIVKEQVSLITKHVCVAMRQYTARRISENNQLIDQALRARIPEYAKNNDQFVLVREEDHDGNESVDIQSTAQISAMEGS